MRSELKHIGYLALASSFIMLGSCRSTDTDNTLGQGVSAININLLGTSFHDGDPGSSQASLGKNASGTYSVERHSVLITPSTFMAAELSSASEAGLNTQASMGKGPMAVIPGAPLGPGMAFRVIAYRQSGDYHTHQDYIVGQSSPVPMMLDNGGTYTMVAYSYGSATLPLISSVEKTDIGSAQVNYNNIDRDFMYYQKPNYIPTELENRLDITLSHKTTLITTIIKSSGYGTIDNIASASITPHFTTGIIPLSTGNITGRGSVVGEALNFPGPFGNITQTATPVFVNADTGGNFASFSANLTIGGVTKPVSLPNSFSIKPGWKKNLTILFSKCGAYVGPNVWKAFMCHNLGADMDADPFTPSAAIHGAKYQWGHKPANATLSDDRYLTQKDDQNPANDDRILGWNTVELPNNSWSDDATKTANDPCPNGYRVPTSAQWQAVIANNNIERTNSSSWSPSSTNFASALYFRDPANTRTLMLPAAGERDISNPFTGAKLYARGYYGYYWSSTASGVGAGVLANIMYFTATDISATGNTNPRNGMPVRCIAE